MITDSPAAPGRGLALAEARLDELRAAIDEYFAARPYSACIAPHETLPDYTAYRVKLVNPVPRKVQTLGRETARAIRAVLGERSIAEPSLERLKEPGALSADAVVSDLDDLCRIPRRRFLIPQVKARTELAMGEHVHAHPASLHAPEWNPERREVTILYKDPEVLFKGKIAVEFYLALGGLPEMRGRSAVAVLRSLLQQVAEGAGEDQQAVQR